MIRRYSRPRHLSPGWAPRAVKASGFTTIPPPPPAGRGSHQGGAPAAAGGQRLPPGGGLGLAGGLGDVDEAPVGALEPVGIGCHQRVAVLEMPSVVAREE